MIYALDHAVKEFLTKGEIEIPPHLINPFLRIMETMERACSASLKYNKMSEQNNQKAFYSVVEWKTDNNRNCETCGNQMPLGFFSGMKNPSTRCPRLCDATNGFDSWKPSCGEKVVIPN